MSDDVLQTFEVSFHIQNAGPGGPFDGPTIYEELISVVEGIAERDMFDNMHLEFTFRSDEDIDHISEEIQDRLSEHDTDDSAIVRLRETKEVRVIRKDLYDDELRALSVKQEDDEGLEE